MLFRSSLNKMTMPGLVKVRSAKEEELLKIEGTGLAKVYPAEEAKSIFDIDLSGMENWQDWSVKVSPGKDGFDISYFTPDKWEYTDLEFKGGELVNYKLILPEGKGEYTKAEYEALIAQQKAEALSETDIQTLFPTGELQLKPKKMAFPFPKGRFPPPKVESPALLKLPKKSRLPKVR